MRIYELMFVVDPRASDEEVVELSEEYKRMIASGGAEVVKEESWGKRRLAYPIEKLNEGKYVLFYVRSEGANPFPEVEQRMVQNDKVLRFLTVRTDREIPGTVAPAREGRAGVRRAAAAGTAAAAEGGQ